MERRSVDGAWSFGRKIHKQLTKKVRMRASGFLVTLENLLCFRSALGTKILEIENYSSGLFPRKFSDLQN